MGHLYWYDCGKCGYRAKVSGRADRGKDFFVQTIVCRECKQLYDAVTRIRLVRTFGGPHQPRRGGLRVTGRFRPSVPIVPPTFEAAAGRLPARDLKQFKWVEFAIQCPVSARHHVQVWNEPGGCPRCGVYLDRAAQPFRIWE